MPLFAGCGDRHAPEGKFCCVGLLTFGCRGSLALTRRVVSLLTGWVLRACELAPGRAPLIFDREALRAPTH
jgi:hypothetical protein